MRAELINTTSLSAFGRSKNKAGCGGSKIDPPRKGRLVAERGVEHVILFIFDSFRPDYLAMYDLPNLRQLVYEGVYYGNARGVMPSTTTTNHTSILTGAYPNHTGIPNNAQYNRETDQIVAPLRDIQVPTLPEIL